MSEPAYERYLEALKLLGLQPPLTWDQIRTAYRELSRKLHPDRNSSPTAAEDMARVTEAYKLLEGYVKYYRFRFNEEEYLAQNPRERIRKQFLNSDEWRSEPRKRR